MKRIRIEIDYDETKFKEVFIKQFFNGIVGLLKTTLNSNRALWGRQMLEEIGNETNSYRPLIKVIEYSDGTIEQVELWEDEN